MADTDTLTRPDTQRAHVDGDHDLFAHIALADDIARCTVTGEELVALCGKRWVPCRDPDGLPVCPECTSIAGTLGAKGAQARLRQLNGRT